MRIVVSSFDGYLWLIPIFVHFYKKMWPDNPYQTDFVSETMKVEGVNTFRAGKLPWADKMIKYLESIEDETFLLFLEEYILNRRVATDEIKRAEELCVDDIGCVRLFAHDGFSHFLIDVKIEGFKEYPLDKPYSLSLQTSIWQRKFFLELLKKGESCWKLEIEGSRRICKSNKKVIWNDNTILNYHLGGYMKKGKVVKSVEQWVRENW